MTIITIIIGLMGMAFIGSGAYALTQCDKPTMSEQRALRLSRFGGWLVFVGVISLMLFVGTMENMPL